jgi:hypothetical protein
LIKYSAPEIIASILGRRSLDELRRGINERDLHKVERILKGVRIQVVHRAEKKFKYKITKLAPTTPGTAAFSNEEGNQITISDYFLRRYNKRLNYPFLPCVVVKRDTHLPMEIVSSPRYNRKLNEKQTVEMIKFTCQKPNVRANKINQGLTLLQHRDNPYLQQFGMAVSPNMSIIKASVLATPKISYSPTSQEPEFAPQGGAWNLRGKKVAQGATIGSWSVVNFADHVPKPSITRFIRELCQTFAATGLNVIKRDPQVTDADPQGNIDLVEGWKCCQSKSSIDLVYLAKHRCTSLC